MLIKALPPLCQCLSRLWKCQQRLSSRGCGACQQLFCNASQRSPGRRWRTQNVVHLWADQGSIWSHQSEVLIILCFSFRTQLLLSRYNVLISADMNNVRRVYITWLPSIRSYGLNLKLATHCLMPHVLEAKKAYRSETWFPHDKKTVLINK